MWKVWEIKKNMRKRKRGLGGVGELDELCLFFFIFFFIFDLFGGRVLAVIGKKKKNFQNCCCWPDPHPYLPPLRKYIYFFCLEFSAVEKEKKRKEKKKKTYRCQGNQILKAP